LSYHQQRIAAKRKSGGKTRLERQRSTGVLYGGGEFLFAISRSGTSGVGFRETWIDGEGVITVGDGSVPIALAQTHSCPGAVCICIARVESNQAAVITNRCLQILP